MRVIFADTGYWVAVLNPHDDLHSKAISFSKSLQPIHIVTSEMVLAEVSMIFPIGEIISDKQP